MWALWDPNTFIFYLHIRCMLKVVNKALSDKINCAEEWSMTLELDLTHDLLLQDPADCGWDPGVQGPTAVRLLPADVGWAQAHDGHSWVQCWGERDEELSWGWDNEGKYTGAIVLGDTHGHGDTHISVVSCNSTVIGRYSQIHTQCIKATVLLSKLLTRLI